MLSELLTTSNVLAVLAVMGVIFGIYRYFHDPQVEGDKKDALYMQQIQYKIETDDKRFTEINQNFKDLVAMNQNHLHTVDTKVETLQRIVEGMGREITKLSTIIDERIPKHKR